MLNETKENLFDVFEKMSAKELPPRSDTFPSTNKFWVPILDSLFPIYRPVPRAGEELYGTVENVNAADKEAGREDDFENEDCSDLLALEDEVDGIITDSIQAVVDTILFGLSTLSTTKSLDVGVSNKITERHWHLPDSQIPPDFPDAQDTVDFDKEEKLKYAFDGYTINQDLSNEVMIDYSQWIAVGLLKTHSVKYTTTSCFFKTYVEKTYTRYYPAEPADELSTQQDYAESIVMAKNEDAIANIIHGFCMPAGLPWYMVDEVYVPINYAYKGKTTQQTGLVNKIPFDVDYVQNIPQQASDSLDCGIFVCAYAEILSEGLQVHSCGFDAASQRTRYAFLLWHYGVKKANEGYTSDNGDPPRPRKSVIE
ncbi:hypothetical protein CQW23_02889 [Capsicum baccatum]|uniref:Ubiquitin-like protease family profile domain-containing protein n=1 Tax=Capsicum baccatum TaxID=33114 RepID=A0A2G2XSQ1_CAPBA|nr:hypothetical protein CQW23_02889 [Capsicum baccatum]